MKKSKYYIQTRKDGRLHAEIVEGYLLQDKTGIKYGAKFYKGIGWEITEISTGSLITTSNIHPKNKDDISRYINGMRPAVLSVLKSERGRNMSEQLNKLIEWEYGEGNENRL